MRGFLQTFLAHRRGNVAVIVALALAPLSLAALGALDIARATAAKLELQDALDAAALDTAKTTVSDATQLQATGDRIFRQNLKLDADVSLTSDTFTFGTGGTVQAVATASLRPLILGSVIGGNIPLGAHTEVKRAGYELEIALVLDNTGSMAGSKLTNLKTAASNFIDSMAAAAAQTSDPNAVKISLVPFAQTVRLSTTFATAAWMDQSGSSPINNEIFTTSSGTQWANRFTLMSQLGTSWRGCVESRQAPYDIQDTAPTTGATLFTPYFWPDEPDKPNGSADNNYLSDGNNGSWFVRQGSVTKYVRTSGLGSSSGPGKGCAMKTLMRLTTDYAGLKSAISGMVASGSTNIPLGMMWGWHTLSPNTPFADGVAYLTPKHKKIVILMTDGENTMDDNGSPPNANVTDYSGVGYLWQGRVLKADGTRLTSGTVAERTAALDDRLAKLCTNMKAADKDIEIYTMRVEVTGGTSTVLQNCASATDHYFDVQNAADLNAVFQQIAGQIASLHLSK